MFTLTAQPRSPEPCWRFLLRCECSQGDADSDGQGLRSLLGEVLLTQGDRQINHSMAATQEILAPVPFRDSIVKILKRKAGPCGRVGGSF